MAFCVQVTVLAMYLRYLFLKETIHGYMNVGIIHGYEMVRGV